MIETAQDDLEGVIFKLVGQREELRGALSELRDEQNGAPLEKHRKTWEAAMEKADRLLSNVAPSHAEKNL